MSERPMISRMTAVSRPQRRDDRVGVAIDLVPSRPEVRLAPPRLRVHSAKPKVGLRTTRPDEMWHIDTTVIRPVDGTCAYLHAVIDNFSRRILAWHVADTFAATNSVGVLLEASRGRNPFSRCPRVVGGRGYGERERPGRRIDRHWRRLLAFTELKFSNSVIEAWWRSQKHHWLLHPLESVATAPPLLHPEPTPGRPWRAIPRGRTDLVGDSNRCTSIALASWNGKDSRARVQNVVKIARSLI